MRRYSHANVHINYMNMMNCSLRAAHHPTFCQNPPSHDVLTKYTPLWYTSVYFAAVAHAKQLVPPENDDGGPHSAQCPTWCKPQSRASPTTSTTPPPLPGSNVAVPLDTLNLVLSGTGGSASHGLSFQSRFCANPRFGRGNLITFALWR
ncbi:hypothetical protein ACQRIT_000375 [Beauveria bassiana]